MRQQKGAKGGKGRISKSEPDIFRGQWGPIHLVRMTEYQRQLEKIRRQQEASL